MNIEQPGKPAELLATPFDEMTPRFSPDGNYIAYASNESGRFEIYVMPFSGGGSSRGKWQVSTRGGIHPAWSRDGREIFFVGPAPERNLMAVSVSTAGRRFEVSVPQVLFPTQLPAHLNFAVSPDGKRFLLPIPVEQAVAEPLVVVGNWQSLLQR